VGESGKTAASTSYPDECSAILARAGSGEPGYHERRGFRRLSRFIFPPHQAPRKKTSSVTSMGLLSRSSFTLKTTSGLRMRQNDSATAAGAAASPASHRAHLGIRRPTRSPSLDRVGPRGTRRGKGVLGMEDPVRTTSPAKMEMMVIPVSRPIPEFTASCRPDYLPALSRRPGPLTVASHAPQFCDMFGASSNTSRQSIPGSIHAQHACRLTMTRPCQKSTRGSAEALCPVRSRL
jgi:hypothetical protein